MAQSRAAKVRVGNIRATQVRRPQVDRIQVRLEKRRVAEVGLAEVGPFEVCRSKLRPSQGGVSEVRRDDGDDRAPTFRRTVEKQPRLGEKLHDQSSARPVKTAYRCQRGCPCDRTHISSSL